MALTLLAGDAFRPGARLRADVARLVRAGADPPRRRRRCARRRCCISAWRRWAAACLIPALALLAGGAGWDLRFAAIRAHPPEGWQAGAVLLLALVGAGSKAGLAPLHVWLPPAHAAAPCACLGADVGRHDQGGAVCAGARAVRPVRPGAADLVGRAAAGAGRRRRRAGRAARQHGRRHQVGAGLLDGREYRPDRRSASGWRWPRAAADLSTLAALALGGAMLHALAHGLFKSLLFVGAGAVQHGAGIAVAGAAGRADPPHAGHHRLRAGGRGLARRAAAQRRVRRRMDAVAGGAGRPAHRRARPADAGLRGGGADGAGGGAGGGGCGAAGRGGVPGPAALAARRGGRGGRAAGARRA